MPLHATQSFLLVALVVGYAAGRDVGDVSIYHEPHYDNLQQALRVYESGGPMLSATHPSIGWVVAAGLGVAVLYALSVLAHELGHLAAARLAGADVAGVRLQATGGFVELDDDDTLTAGRLAAIAVAGPIATAGLVLVSGLLLVTLGWPLTGMPDVNTGAAATSARLLSAVFAINLVGLVLNLLPIRPLDGRHLLTAARLWRGRS